METAIEDNQSVDLQVKKILKSIPDSLKIQLLISLMREVTGDPAKAKQMGETLSKKS